MVRQLCFDELLTTVLSRIDLMAIHQVNPVEALGQCFNPLSTLTQVSDKMTKAPVLFPTAVVSARF